MDTEEKLEVLKRERAAYERGFKDCLCGVVIPIVLFLLCVIAYIFSIPNH